MIRLFTARDGSLTAEHDGKLIHSSYSPLKEADKLYTSLGLSAYKNFILLEPGLNYIGLKIRQHAPDSKIITIRLSVDFDDCPDNYSDYSWSPGSDIPVKDFLYGSMKELDLQQLQIVSLPSTASIYRTASDRINQIIVQHIRELHGNITTASGFNSRLYRNFFKNYLSIDRYLTAEISGSAAFIAGSGPGLSGSLDFLKKNRRRLRLIALPSSIDFLLHHGLTPDFVVTTDPGFYAARHLQNLDDTRLAAPYTANIGNPEAFEKVLTINQSNFIDTRLLGADDSCLKLPPNGTVAGTALYLCSALTGGPVFISGLDFSFIDVLSHNRPHSFDSLIEEKAERSRPVENLYYSRNLAGSLNLGGGRRTTSAMNTYRGWFAQNSGAFSDRFYFLDYYTETPGCFKNLTQLQAENILENGRDYRPADSFRKAPPLEIRKARINRFLENSLSESAEIRKLFEKKIDIAKALGRLVKSSEGQLFMPDILELKRIQLAGDHDEMISKSRELFTKHEDFINRMRMYAE